jgi:hypothetical protein
VYSKPKALYDGAFAHHRITTALVLIVVFATPSHAQQAEELFFDDFESDLAGWAISDPEAIRVLETQDPSHGNVLLLSPAHAKLHALIRGSDAWEGYRIEGEVLFPQDVHNYLGLIYSYSRRGDRVDLGSIYIKGNGSYVRVNPRRDWNPSRMLYEEYRTPLRGRDTIRIGEWQSFAMEVVGNVCHLYVGDMTVPKVTFDYYEHAGGRVGFKPRVVGGSTWLDNVRATAIKGLSYEGSRQPPGIEHRPDELVTTWKVLGPLAGSDLGLEQAADPVEMTVAEGGVEFGWRDFDTDPRGAVVTGRVTDFLGDRTVAYFLTTIEISEGEVGRFEFSSIDHLAFWVNGSFEGYSYRDRIAWHDFGRNPDHPPTAALPLQEGINRVLIRARGGVYASGGFFARVVLE